MCVCVCAHLSAHVWSCHVCMFSQRAVRLISAAEHSSGVTFSATLRSNQTHGCMFHRLSVGCGEAWLMRVVSETLCYRHSAPLIWWFSHFYYFSRDWSFFWTNAAFFLAPVQKLNQQRGTNSYEVLLAFNATGNRSGSWSNVVPGFWKELHVCVVVLFLACVCVRACARALQLHWESYDLPCLDTATIDWLI